MLQEIVIIFDEKNTSKKGAYFENLVNDIFSQQRYDIQGNVNVTGQEFDLICTHKDRNGEKILIECKAKESLGAPDVNLFNFKVSDNKFTHGIFIYTKDFAHQACGTIIDKWKDDERYKNLSFWNGKKVIELLVESKQIKKFNFSANEFQLTKIILFFSFNGFYYIPLFSNTTQPKYFSIFNAKTLQSISEKKIIDNVKKYVKDTEQLDFYSLGTADKIDKIISSNDDELETIAEVSESQSWYDYKPASLKYFVGRNEFIVKITNLIKDVVEKKTTDRVFYIDGKSGWGKSSLLVALRGKYRNRHYRNKYFSYIVDSRSANSQSFISLAFNNMLKKAYEQKFIPKELYAISIPSHFDILGAAEIDDLKQYLEENNKSLILVFDQFEDIFRKESILRSFFKLLTDINSHQSNLVLGFSWKSETIISADEKNISRLLSQSKEHSVSITMSEFNIEESRKIIKQLEGDIGEKLDEEFKRRIIDNSQGFPWLVKKLCVHIYKQLQGGTTLDNLFSQDLNVESLFKNDLEDCNEEEIKALRLIAKRAYSSNMFDRIEVNEIIPEIVITELTNKNLIIKTGTKYNIYWDIFRDYLVTNEVPKVGETYLIRNQPGSVFEVLTFFENKKEMTLEEVSAFTSNSQSTVENLLRALRDFALIKYQNDKYSLKDASFKIDESTFKNFIKTKIEKHIFYLELIKIKDKEIGLDDITNIIKSKINTGRSYADTTLLGYSQLFFNWLNYVEISIGNLQPELLQRAKNENTFTPQEKPTKVIEFFNSINEMDEYQQSKILSDLRALGLIHYKNNKITLTKDGKEAKKDNKVIFDNALKTQKVSFAYEKYCDDVEIKAKDFRGKIEEILSNLNHEVYIKSTSRKLYEWSKLIYVSKNTGKKLES